MAGTTRRLWEHSIHELPILLGFMLSQTIYSRATKGAFELSLMITCRGCSCCNTGCCRGRGSGSCMVPMAGDAVGRPSGACGCVCNWHNELQRSVTLRQGRTACVMRVSTEANDCHVLRSVTAKVHKCAINVPFLPMPGRMHTCCTRPLCPAMRSMNWGTAGSCVATPVCDANTCGCITARDHHLATQHRGCQPSVI